MRYRAELLPNGLIRVYDYECQWATVYNNDGTFYFGPGTPLRATDVLSLLQNK